MDTIKHAENIYRKQFPDVTKLTVYDCDLINLMALTLQEYKFHELVKNEILNHFKSDSLIKEYTIDTGECFDFDEEDFYYQLTKIDIENICNNIRKKLKTK